MSPGVRSSITQQAPLGVNESGMDVAVEVEVEATAGAGIVGSLQLGPRPGPVPVPGPGAGAWRATVTVTCPVTSLGSSLTKPLLEGQTSDLRAFFDGTSPASSGRPLTFSAVTFPPLAALDVEAGVDVMVGIVVVVIVVVVVVVVVVEGRAAVVIEVVSCVIVVVVVVVVVKLLLTA